MGTQDIARQAGVSSERLSQALTWQVMFWSGETITEDQQAAFEHWLLEHPENRRAWEKVADMDQRLSGVPGTLARETLKTGPRMSRRQLLSLLGVGVAALGAGGLAGTRPVRHRLADYRSGTGEQRNLSLPDGSSLLLNTRSAVNIQFERDQRRMVLMPGSEVLLHTEPGPVPMVVQTPVGEIVEQKGQLLIRDFHEYTRVLSLQGQVLLRPSHGEALLLKPGMKAFMRRDGVTGPLEAPEGMDSWTRGLLTANNRRLADFLEELSRYRPGMLYCDEQVADLRLTGSFPLRDTDFVLESLVQALPVRLARYGHYLIRVLPA